MTEDCLLSERGSYYKINAFIHNGETERDTELGGMDQEHLTVWMRRATYTDTKEQMSRKVCWIGVCLEQIRHFYEEWSIEETCKT